MTTNAMVLKDVEKLPAPIQFSLPASSPDTSVALVWPNGTAVSGMLPDVITPGVGGSPILCVDGFISFTDAVTLGGNYFAANFSFTGAPGTSPDGYVHIIRNDISGSCYATGVGSLGGPAFNIVVSPGTSNAIVGVVEITKMHWLWT